MRFIDWFAGIGGFRRGMELAGHECVGYCEFDRFASASYRSMHTITEEQREYLETLDPKKRQKEIMKEKYLNGEWYAKDVRTVNASDIPASDCWCFGFPCQDISVAGKQVGFYGNRSSLFFRIMYLLGQQDEEKKPSYLFIENVKNLLSVNRGWDFARLLVEMDRGGYDAEWSVLNSKDYGVPQNRERCFIIGHLRGRSTSKVFPVERTDRKDNICGSGLGGVFIPCITPDRTEKRQNGRRFKEDGEPSFTLTGVDRHGIAVEVSEGVWEIGKPVGSTNTQASKDFIRISGDGGVAKCIKAQNDAGVVIRVKEATKKGYSEAREGCDAVNLSMPGSKTRRGRVGVDMANTLDTQCNQGIFVKISPELTVYAVWYPKKKCYVAIRKLTPKECFRLQGWEDEYFEKARFVNSDSQLYKQAGNGVTVNVIEAMAKKMEIREDGDQKDKD